VVVERSRNELAKIRQEVSPFYWFIHIDSHLALPLFRMLQKLDLLSEDCTIFPAGSGLFVGLFSQVGLDATAIEPDSGYLEYAKALTTDTVLIYEESNPFNIVSRETVIIDLYTPFFVDFESLVLFFHQCIDYVLLSNTKVILTILSSKSGVQQCRLVCGESNYTLLCLTKEQLSELSLISEKKGLNLSCEIISESFIGDEDLQREVLIISPTP
jgi:hypothetical protein